MPKVKKTARKSRQKTTRAKQKQGVLQHFSRLFTAGIAGATVLAAGGVALLWSGGYVGLMGEKLGRLSNSVVAAAGFEVRRVTAIGLEHVDEQAVLTALGPVVGASIAHFDPYTARARVEELGWVRSAAVSRLWPDTIHVSVRERTPAAVWQVSGVLNLIDAHGAVIREIDAYEYSQLPLIVGAGAPESASVLLQALRAEQNLWGEAAALIRVGDRRWNLRLKSGADVKFPETNPEAAVRQLSRLHDAYGLLDRSLEYVDLRDPNNLVMRERDGEETSALEDS